MTVDLYTVEIALNFTVHVTVTINMFLFHFISYYCCSMKSFKAKLYCKKLTNVDLFVVVFFPLIS